MYIDEEIDPGCEIAPFAGQILVLTDDMGIYRRSSDEMIIIHDLVSGECLEFNDLSELAVYLDDDDYTAVEQVLYRIDREKPH